MPAFRIEIFTYPSIDIEADSPEEAVRKVQDDILEGRLPLTVDVQIEGDPDGGGYRTWHIGRDITDMIEEATSSGAN